MAKKGILCANGRTMHRNEATRAKCRECQALNRRPSAGARGWIAPAVGGAVAQHPGVDNKHPDTTTVDLDKARFGNRGRIKVETPDVDVAVMESGVYGKVFVRDGGRKGEDTYCDITYSTVGKGANVYASGVQMYNTELNDYTTVNATDSILHSSHVDRGRHNLRNAEAHESTFFAKEGGTSLECRKSGESIIMERSTLSGGVRAAGRSHVENSYVENANSLPKSLRFMCGVSMSDSYVKTRGGIGDIAEYGLPMSKDGATIDARDSFGIDYEVGPGRFKSALVIPVDSEGKVFVTGDGENHEYRLQKGTPGGEDAHYYHYGTHTEKGFVPPTVDMTGMGISQEIGRGRAMRDSWKSRGRPAGQKAGLIEAPAADWRHSPWVRPK